MKRGIISSLFTLSLCLASGCASHGSNADQMRAVAAAEALDQQFVTAFNQHNVDGVMATYWNSPDLVVCPPETLEWKGWNAVRDGYAKAFAQPGGAAKLEMDSSHYLAIGDAVVGWGTFKVRVPGVPGPKDFARGRYTEVIAQRNGKWVYIIDHASLPLEEIAPPGAKP
jgi:ketosteroid isomerase-like protein